MTLAKSTFRCIYTEKCPFQQDDGGQACKGQIVKHDKCGGTVFINEAAVIRCDSCLKPGDQGWPMHHWTVVCKAFEHLATCHQPSVAGLQDQEAMRRFVRAYSEEFGRHYHNNFDLVSWSEKLTTLVNGIETSFETSTRQHDGEAINGHATKSRESESRDGLKHPSDDINDSGHQHQASEVKVDVPRSPVELLTDNPSGENHADQSHRSESNNRDGQIACNAKGN